MITKKTLTPKRFTIAQQAVHDLNQLGIITTRETFMLYRRIGKKSR